MDKFTLTDWAQIISAVGTMMAAIVAVIAAIQSYRSARQNNETNEQMIRPRVIVYVENSKQDISFIDLVICNEGGGFARDITFNTTGDPIPMEYSNGTKKTLGEFDVIKKGIRMLPAKSSRRYFILSMVGQVDEMLSKNTFVKVSYKNSAGDKSYTDQFLLDFVSLPRMQFTDRNESARKKLANETEQIRKLMERRK